MALTEQEIRKYQELYLQKYGKRISTKESEKQLGKLVLLVQTVVKNYSSK
jgi:hypothetical protein